LTSLSALIDGLCVLLGGAFLGLAAAASGERFVAALAFLLLVGGLALMVGSAFVTVPGA
jgi:hypothetical protein